MDKATLNRILKLINNSGLWPSETKPKQDIPYDFSNETILITGAAGSIGSCLAQLLISSKFKQLILLDNAETPLYYLKCDIKAKKSDAIEFILSDIRNKESMECLFETYRPTLVFHTAAYKHVSLMEHHPYEAVKVNIMATKHLAELSIRSKTKKFIFISTDKAVNPVGVMGMTKLIAENYLNLLQDTGNTVFISTRFGNIFGSNGSVVPLFIKQLQNGYPITVTDANVSRLFIDKTKACNLILKVASLTQRDNAKVSFDMGKPIKILDLVKVLNAAFSTDYETPLTEKILITGLSNGEKLHESMITKNEKLVPSDSKGIFFIQKKKNPDSPIEIRLLEDITPSIKAEEAKSILKNICNYYL